jgi:hypothetical protein
MKVKNILVESGASIKHRQSIELVTLVEGIAADMQAISNASVAKPFAQFKKEQLSVFVKRLKAWAVSALHELRPSMAYHHPEKSYIDTLNKIINNPQETAEQIFSAVIAKQVVTGNNSTPSKPASMPSSSKSFGAANDSKKHADIDDILSSITF